MDSGTQPIVTKAGFGELKLCEAAACSGARQVNSRHLENNVRLYK